MRLLFFLLLLPVLAISQRARDTTYVVQVRDSFGLKFQVVRENREELIDSAEFVRRAFVAANATMLPVRDAARAWLNSDANRKLFNQSNDQLRAASGRIYFQLYRTIQGDTAFTGLWLLRQVGQPANQARALEYKNGRFRECTVRIRERQGLYKILSYVQGGINDVPQILNGEQFVLQTATGAANRIEFYQYAEEASINPALFRRIYGDMTQANGRPRFRLEKRTEIDEDSEQGKAILNAGEVRTLLRKP